MPEELKKKKLNAYFAGSDSNWQKECTFMTSILFYVSILYVIYKNVA